MTLVQLKYIITVAEQGNITRAAKELFLSQPSLTAAIRELENELGIEIFARTNKGVSLTPEGEEFLSYARQVMDQIQLIEGRYGSNAPIKHEFCVSTQHYSFAVEAFVELIKQFGGEQYDFRIRETKTHELIDDVAHLRSAVGVLYLNEFNRAVLQKTIKENELTFHSLFVAKPHVFVSAFSPLAKKTVLTLEDLAPYPRLSYEQGEHNSFYFSEEILSTMECKKDIMVSDRATLFNLLIGLNGYTICSGVINRTLNGENIIAIPLAVDDYMEIGYITHNRLIPDKLTAFYIEALKKYTEGRTA